MGDWAKDKKPVWEKVCEQYGGSKEAFDWGTWGFFDWAVGKAWPTISSISKARKFGWHRHDDTFETWIETFRTFENAGILPQNHLLHTKASPLKAVNGVSNGTEKVSNGIKEVYSVKNEELTNHGDPKAEAPSVVAA